MAVVKSDFSIDDEPMSEATMAGSTVAEQPMVHADAAPATMLEGDFMAASPVASATPHSSTESDAMDEGLDSTDLLTELARAMHDAADLQFARITADLERQRLRQVESIVARATFDTDDVKAELDADTRAIDAWAKAEAEKIKVERTRRIDARRDEHAAKVEREATIKEREILAVEVAIESHLAELNSFFAEIKQSTDPGRIASMAATKPASPALDEIAGDARRSAGAEFALRDSVGDIALDRVVDDEPLLAATTIDEPRLIAVMEPAEPDSATPNPARTWGSADAQPWGAEVARPWEPAALAESGSDEVRSAAGPAGPADPTGEMEPLLPMQSNDPGRPGESTDQAPSNPPVQAAPSWRQPSSPGATPDGDDSVDEDRPIEATMEAQAGAVEASGTISRVVADATAPIQQSDASPAEIGSHGSTLLRAIAAFRPMASNSNHAPDTTDKEH